MTDIEAKTLYEFEKADFRAETSFVFTGSLPAAEQFLSENEIKTLAGIKLEKRRLEWQAGRLAAKKLLQNHTGLPLKQMEVSYDESHRPLCAGHLISITHSGGLAAAAYAGGQPVGADLEIIKPHSQAWINDYFFDDEVPSGLNDEALKAWTRKEAALKALGIGLSVSAKCVNVAKEKPVFLGKALGRYESLGFPVLEIRTAKAGNWYFSAVSAQR